MSVFLWLVIVLDIETNDRSRYKSEPVQLGAVALCVEHNPAERKSFAKERSLFESLIRPRKSCSWHAERTHGITPEMLAEADVFETCWSRFVDWCQQLYAETQPHRVVLVGHNVQAFDLCILDCECQRNHIDFLGGTRFDGVLDTLKWSQQEFPEQPYHTVGATHAFLLGTSFRDAHRALPDAQAVAKFVQHPQFSFEHWMKYTTSIFVVVRHIRHLTLAFAARQRKGRHSHPLAMCKQCRALMSTYFIHHCVPKVQTLLCHLASESINVSAAFNENSNSSVNKSPALSLTQRLARVGVTWSPSLFQTWNNPSLLTFRQRFSGTKRKRWTEKGSDGNSTI